MIHNPLVSIMVPAYNASKYLERCLNSIRNQTYHNLEILCVDDYSSDNTADIIKTFSDIDSRFLYLKREGEEGGEAAARNTALIHANGDYMAACDADDYMLPEMIELLVRKIQEDNSDIVYCSRYCFYEDYGAKQKHVKIRPSVLQHHSPVAINKLYEVLFDIPLEVWVKMYRIKNSGLKNIRFPTNVKIGTDACHNTELLCNAKMVSFITQPLYCYCIRNSSLSHQTDQRMQSQALMHVYIHDKLKQYGLLVPCKKSFLKFLYSNATSNCLVLPKELQTEYINAIHSLIHSSNYFNIFINNKVLMKLLQKVYYVLYHLVPGGRNPIRNYFKNLYKKYAFYILFY